MAGESDGISTRYLLGAFFAVVLLCAVFFSLGYFLGYREGHPGTPLTQQVAASSDVPAPANASTGEASAAESSAGQPAPSTDSQTPATETANPDQSTAASDNAAVQSAAAPGAAAATTETQPEPAASGSAAPTSEPPADDEGQMTPARVPSGLLIQVGAVRGRAEAVQMAETLRSGGYHAMVLTPALVGAGDSFFRVVAGPYKSHATAEAALKKLSREGYKPFIRQ